MHILTYLRIHYDSHTASKQWRSYRPSNFRHFPNRFCYAQQGCAQCDTAPLNIFIIGSTFQIALITIFISNILPSVMIHYVIFIISISSKLCITQSLKQTVLNHHHRACLKNIVPKRLKLKKNTEVGMWYA